MDYVVDVYVALSIAVSADDEQQAKSIAFDIFDEQIVGARITRAIEPTDFSVSDSDLRFEVGEA